jgi:hypothetical protein
MYLRDILRHLSLHSNDTWWERHYILQVDLLQKKYRVLYYLQDTLVLRWHLGMDIQNPIPLILLDVAEIDQYPFLSLLQSWEF